MSWIIVTNCVITLTIIAHSAILLIDLSAVTTTNDAPRRKCGSHADLGNASGKLRSLMGPRHCRFESRK